LAAGPGARIAIVTNGPDAAAALARLVDFVTTPLPDTSKAHHE
jgi:phosphotransferase system HPr-like phosphotransfer protein